MKKIILILGCSLVLVSEAQAQYQSYLRGSDLPRAIAKKLGFNINSSVGINCEPYVGSVDQTNVLRGSPSMETGQVTSLIPDGSALQQLQNDIDSCVSLVKGKHAAELAGMIFSEDVLDSFCPLTGLSLCPPGSASLTKQDVAGQLLIRHGYYKRQFGV